MPSGTAIDHERMRWEYMDFRQLSIRLGKITKLEKLETFLWYCERAQDGRERARIPRADIRRLHEHALERARILGYRQDLERRYPVPVPVSARGAVAELDRNAAQSNREVVNASRWQPARTVTGRVSPRLGGLPPPDIETVVSQARETWRTAGFHALSRWISGQAGGDVSHRLLHDFAEFLRMMAISSQDVRERECCLAPGEALELMRQAVCRATDLGHEHLPSTIRKMMDQVEHHLKVIAKRKADDQDKCGMSGRVIRIKKKPKDGQTIDDLLEDL